MEPASNKQFHPAVFAVAAIAFAFLLSGCEVDGLSALEPASTGDGGGSGSRSYSSINDTARFLAGMPGGGDARLKELRNTAAWKSHAARMDQLWSQYQARASHIGGFRGELGGLSSPGVLFYPFGGPDYLHARAFFPGAGNYILVGLEGASTLPDLNTLSESEITRGLAGIANSLKTVTGASYFITKDMRVDLESTRFRGAAPLILVMAARSGQPIQSVEPVSIGGGSGVHIRAGGKNIYYVRKDLSGGMGSLASFVRSKGAPVTFIKSASYLMHSGFGSVRSFILSDSRAILQDPSGVPFSYLSNGNWNVTLYGNYTGPLSLFSQYNQPDLARAYREKSPHPVKPIGFGVGYLRSPSNACLILARRSGSLAAAN